MCPRGSRSSSPSYSSCCSRRWIVPRDSFSRAVKSGRLTGCGYPRTASIMASAFFSALAAFCIFGESFRRRDKRMQSGDCVPPRATPGLGNMETGNTRDLYADRCRAYGAEASGGRPHDAQVRVEAGTLAISSLRMGSGSAMNIPPITHLVPCREPASLSRTMQAILSRPPLLRQQRAGAALLRFPRSNCS